MNTSIVRRFTLLGFAAISLTVLSGCHKKSAAPPPPLAPDSSMESGPAPTATLTADPLSIDLGQSVVLNWRTQNATSVTIDGVGPVATNGTQNVTPSTSTNFHLTATSASGKTAEANVRVTVRVPETPTVPTATSSDLGNEGEFKQNVQDIFFDYDSYDLRAGDAATISKAAGYLASHNVRLVIGGYCDERGSAEYNLALGENRANAAKAALVQAGVAADRIRIISYGKEKQFCTEQNEACYQQNRRAQFNLDR